MVPSWPTSPQDAGAASSQRAARRLVEAAPAQVVGDDDVGDGVEHELDVVGVGGARHVAVDLLGGGLVLRFELGLDVRSRLAVFLRACNTTHRDVSMANITIYTAPTINKWTLKY